jgi:hypothetical protein
MQLYDRLTTDFGEYGFEKKIGVITPYRSQLAELKARFSRRYGNKIVNLVDFNTTDAFQGRESEIIIFSCVRASPSGGIGFLQDIRRMNVGLTRAKSSLWVLGNSDSLQRGEFWAKLIEDAKSRKQFRAGNYMAELRRATPLELRRQLLLASGVSRNGDGAVSRPIIVCKDSDVVVMRDAGEMSPVKQEVAQEKAGKTEVITASPVGTGPSPSTALPPTSVLMGARPPQQIRRITLKRPPTNPLLPPQRPKKPKPT